MDDATQDIRDFFKAVDAGWLGQMPDGFNRSAFVVALRSRLLLAAAAPGASPEGSSLEGNGVTASRDARSLAAAGLSRELLEDIDEAADELIDSVQYLQETMEAGEGVYESKWLGGVMRAHEMLLSVRGQLEHAVERASMDKDTDGKLFAAALYVITDMWGKEMGDLQRASLANQIVREIERRGIVAAPPVQMEAVATYLIRRERERQIAREGWTEDHDDGHADGEMLAAALCYLWHGTDKAAPLDRGVPMGWPWDVCWWKPRDRHDNVVRAGALMLAEKERLIRAGLEVGHVDHKIAIAERELTALLPLYASPVPSSERDELVEDIDEAADDLIDSAQYLQETLEAGEGVYESKWLGGVMRAHELLLKLSEHIKHASAWPCDGEGDESGNFVCKNARERDDIIEKAVQAEREAILALIDEYDTGGYGSHTNMVIAQRTGIEIADLIRARSAALSRVSQPAQSGEEK